MKRHVWAQILCAAWLVVGHARADKITDAEELFRRGKGLMAEKKDREACPLFEESERLDPQMGTLLNLAICHENVGRIASAWGEFRAVEQQARVANREERVKLAHERAAKLEQRLSRIKLLVPADAKPAGIVVKVDGEAKGEALWSGIPVDVGTRSLEVSAPGKKTATSKVKVDDEGATVSVTLPKLEDAPVARAILLPPPPDDTRQEERYAANRSRKTAGHVLGGVGLGVAVTGGVFGILAIAGDGSAANACPQPCTQGSREAIAADDKTDRALLFANVANVAIPLGLVAAAIGGYLVLTTGPTEKRASSLFIGNVAGRGGSLGVHW